MEESLKFIDFLDDVDDLNNRHARPRLVRTRPNFFEQYDEVDFFKRYRMHKSTALWVLDQIDEELEYTSNRYG